jgi:teichuronic acid exporter
VRKKITGAAIWSTLDVFLNQVVGFAISVILARLLVPEDFGLVAMLSFFTAIANLFVNAGLSIAIIQNKHATIVDESTVFWFNMIVGGLFAITLWAAAPLLALFFEAEVLEPIAKINAVGIFLAACCSLQNTLFIKQLDFKILTSINLIRTISTGGLAIYLATIGYGVWALVYQSLFSSILSLVLIWSFSNWRPIFIFSKDSFHSQIKFGGYVFAAGLLDVIYRRGSLLFMGKMFGPRELGFYTRAENTQNLLSTLLTRSVSRVTFPAFSSVNEDLEKIKRWGAISVSSIMFVTAPILIFIAVYSAMFIEVLFGKQWLPSSSILSILAIAALTFPITKINQNMVTAIGMAKEQFNIQLTKVISGIFLLVIGSFYGMLGVAIGFLINSVFGMFLNLFQVKRRFDFTLIDQCKDSLIYMVLSVLVALLLVQLNLSFTSKFVTFAMIGITGAFLYLALCVVIKDKILMGLFSAWNN